MSVFIVRPFGKRDGVDFDQIERELIGPAMVAAGVTGGTTGVITRSGNIRLDMFERLVLADLVIADISIHNANVFYELGIRHALRDRSTILIRFRRPDEGKANGVPFDLKTDRYLEYALSDLRGAVPALSKAIADSLRAKNVDSPVYLLLPKLAPPSADALRGVPEEFRQAVELAAEHADHPRLGLLAEEIDGFDWAEAGWRLVGKTFFDRNAWTGARTWLEAVRGIAPNDPEANLLLGTVHQKLGDLAESNAAINRVLDHNGLGSWARAEKRALIASNHKTEWIREWMTPAVPERAVSALRAFPRLAVEAYDAAFIEDQNHFYSGLNSLSLRTLELELQKRAPDEWNSRFETDALAAAAVATAQSELDVLRGAVARSIEAARVRDEASVLRKTRSEPDHWIRFSAADYRFLTSTRPGAVAAGYRDAMAAVRGAHFYAEITARQLRMFRDLGVFVDKAEAALTALGEPFEIALAGSAPRRRVVVFSGHRVDKADRKLPRFPPSRVPAATEAIRSAVAGEKTLAKGDIIGVAGAACGGDIIFHELCRDAGIPTTVLLALPEAAYATASVNDAGADWSERYRAILRGSKPEVLAQSEELPIWLAERRGYSIWNRNNLWTLHTALAADNTDVALIVLWDGKGGDGPGGTADMVALARKRGVKIITIDPATLADS